MPTITVNTDRDTVDPGDGLTSLREAVAQANASSAADRIVFAPDLFFVQSNSAANRSAIEIRAGGGALTIDGDSDDDGLADIVLTGGFSNHLTVGKGATATIVGVDFWNGGKFGTGGTAGEAGAPGIPGTPGYSPRGTGGALEINDYGESATNPTAGGDGGDGTAGTEGQIAAGGILNMGFLTLVRAGFGDNAGVGGPGGAGGRGGNGAFGINGGHGILGAPGNRDIPVLDGGNGADGSDGGSGGDGGRGGAGGAAAGGIFNDIGARLVLTDVSFGGRLSSGLIAEGNTATGGQGQTGGAGGNAQNGGNGGYGGNDGFSAVSQPPPSFLVAWTTGSPGAPGNGADGGDGGNGGSGGRGGSAAGAIYNLGSLSGVAAVTDDNDATAGVGRNPGQTAPPGGTRGLHGTGGAAGGDRPGFTSTTDPLFVFNQNVYSYGPPGLDGFDGIAGSAGAFGPNGTTRDGILTEATGRTTATDADALVYIHGLNTAAVEEGGKISFNIIRMGDISSSVTVNWRLLPNGPQGADAADFAGGLASGQVVLAANAAVSGYDRPLAAGLSSTSVRNLTIDVRTDILVEVPEGYRLELTSATSSSSSVSVVLGTRTLNGQIVDGDAIPGPTGGNDDLNLGARNDTINGLGGNDIIRGNDGNDSLNGGAGNDQLFGGNGKDSLVGGSGSDRLSGGLGADQFIFDSKPGRSSVDTITDFNVRDDTIRLEGSIFTDIANGKLSKSEFHASNSGNARDKSDRIIYEKDTGRLFWDEDGKGGDAKVLFADLASGLNLTHKDFFVF